MPRITPNFHFKGNAAEAMALYTRAFGAETIVLLRYADANVADLDAPYPENQLALVYHAEMLLYGQRIMLSDAPVGTMPSDASLSLVITLDTADQVRAAYAILQEGATIIHPMKDSSYSSCFVSLRDRYGIRWELMTEM